MSLACSGLSTMVGFLVFTLMIVGVYPLLVFIVAKYGDGPNNPGNEATRETP